MVKPLVKICGIMRAVDAALAHDAGADAVGLNFLRGPRKIDYRHARDLAVPAGLLTVGLMSYPAPGDVEFSAVQSASGVSTFQLYSDSYPYMPAHGACRVWLVAGIDSRDALLDVVQIIGSLHWRPDALLLDSRVGGQIGGTGLRFDWNWIAEARDAGELAGLPHIVLAGGLTPENVAEAVHIVQPWMVDVSSGVEIPGKPGIKDAAKVRDFVAAAKGH